MNFDDDDDVPSALPSRTQYKHDAQELKSFGEELVNLPAGRFEKLSLPDDLRAAVLEARKITSRPARNRQLQIVGRMLQGVDIPSIRASLRDIDHLPAQPVSPEAAAQTAAINQLVDRLLSGNDEEIFSLSERYPREALQQLRQAVRQAKKKLQTTGDHAAASRLVRDCLAKLP